jgi:hypothetical protein
MFSGGKNNATLKSSEMSENKPIVPIKAGTQREDVIDLPFRE